MNPAKSQISERKVDKFTVCMVDTEQQSDLRIVYQSHQFYLIGIGSHRVAVPRWVLSRARPPFGVLLRTVPSLLLNLRLNRSPAATEPGSAGSTFNSRFPDVVRRSGPCTRIPVHCPPVPESQRLCDPRLIKNPRSRFPSWESPDPRYRAQRQPRDVTWQLREPGSPGPLPDDIVSEWLPSRKYCDLEKTKCNISLLGWS